MPSKWLLNTLQWFPDVFGMKQGKFNPTDGYSDKKREKYQDKSRTCPWIHAYGSPQPWLSEINTTIPLLQREAARNRGTVRVCALRSENWLLVNDFSIQAMGNSDLSAEQQIANMDRLAKDLNKANLSIENAEMADEDGNSSGVANKKIDIEPGQMVFSMPAAELELHKPQVITEKQAIEAHGAQFNLFPTDNGQLPSPEELDRFINAAITWGPNDIIWFHCHGGNSRTQIFLAVYEAIYLAKYPEMQALKDEYIQRDGDKVDPWKHKKLNDPDDPEKLAFCINIKNYIAKYQREIQNEAADSKHKTQRMSWTEYQENIAKAHSKLGGA